MIELHYWPTPNGHKISMFLEEADLPYEIKPVNIGKGDQFKPEYLKISPNNKMPAIVDTDPLGGGDPLSIFESGAILQYLAEKTGKFMPASTRERYVVLEWLFWQVGGLGPMLGQNHHFNRYAPEKIPYATAISMKRTACTAYWIDVWTAVPSSPARITRLPTWRPIRGSFRTRRKA